MNGKDMVRTAAAFTSLSKLTGVLNNWTKTNSPMGVKDKRASINKDTPPSFIIIALETAKDFLSCAKATNNCLEVKHGEANIFIIFMVTEKAANPISALAARETPRFITLCEVIIIIEYKPKGT
ncbi:hypothetical protein SDC9_124887 [bioreactor metagenome]|uniref:Uncharacterized protein n=1 Tax=bioreactor metagenome TaxID=1076179 RepID=A0A645CLW8_9ZZZZ